MVTAILGVGSVQKTLRQVCVMSEKIVPLHRVSRKSSRTISLFVVVDCLCGVGINKVHGDASAFKRSHFRRQAEYRFFLRE